jgi:RNA-directed DNA polymerase
MYTGEQYVLCADLQECLATLKPQALLRKLQTLPAVGRLIKAWLAAGVMDCCPPARTALVPLLVNVALHDLETRLLQACGEEQGDARVVHAAGVLVVLHPALAGVHRARLLTQIWLQELGLTWQPGNLKIAHTLKPYRGNIGFDFLGWAVRHYPTGKKRVGRGAKDLSPGCVTIIRAGREHTWQHMAEIKRVLNEHRAASQETLIRQLNPLIEKWAASCRATGATQDLAACDHQLWWLLWRWARRRHANKGQAWIRDRYWYRAETRRWIFGCRRGPTLRLYTQARGQFRPQESPACSASEHLPLFAARESQCLCTVRQPIQQIRSLYRREQDWCHSQVTIH